jgi:hypothetical protein
MSWEEVDTMELNLESLEMLHEENLTGSGCIFTCGISCLITALEPEPIDPRDPIITP